MTDGSLRQSCLAQALNEADAVLRSGGATRSRLPKPQRGNYLAQADHPRARHGKRADSIVKNMLLYSREGSGEHRLADINALADGSLNLAYIPRRPASKSKESPVSTSKNPVLPQNSF